MQDEYYRLFSVLNFSQASFNALNTAPAIILCSVVASVEICEMWSVLERRDSGAETTYLVGMTFRDTFHVDDLDFVG